LVDAVRPALPRVEVALLEAVRPDAVLVDAAFDALFEALFAAVFPSAPRVAADLPPFPVAVLPPAVLRVAAFEVADLLAPVLLADLRGLVVAMHVSRLMVAPPRRPTFDNTRRMQAR
jgi:hypothetical protein